MRSSAVLVIGVLVTALGGAGSEPRAADVEARIVQVDLRTGRELSRTRLGRERSVGPMSVGDGVLVLSRVRCLSGDAPYAPGDAEVTGTDAKSGATRWRMRDVEIFGGDYAEQPVVGSTIILTDVVEEGHEQRVHLVDAQSGRVRWSRPSVTTWVLTQNREFVVASDDPRSARSAQAPATEHHTRQLHVIDRRSGHDRWMATIPDVAPGSDVRAVAGAGVVVAHASVRSPSAGFDVPTAFVFDATTGALSASYPIDGSMVGVFGGTLVTSDILRWVAGRDVRTGAELWMRNDAWTGTNPLVPVERLVATSTVGSRRYLGLDPATGLDEWSVDVDRFSPSMQNATTALLWYAGDGLMAIDLTDGSKRWRRRPIVVDDRRYFDDEVQPARPTAIGRSVAAFGIACARDSTT